MFSFAISNEFKTGCPLFFNSSTKSFLPKISSSPVKLTCVSLRFDVVAKSLLSAWLAFPLVSAYVALSLVSECVALSLVTE